MINFNFKKGFTLIELLVVISIIGLLSSIAMASLGTARVKAADSAIKSDLSGIRSSAEIEYSTLGYSYNTTGAAVNTPDTVAYINSGNVAGTILGNQKIKDAIAHIASVNGGQPITTNIPSDGKTYTISVPLKTPLNLAVLDSTSGNIKITGSLVAPTLTLEQDPVFPTGLYVRWVDASNNTFASSYSRTVSYKVWKKAGIGAWGLYSMGPFNNPGNDKMNYYFYTAMPVSVGTTDSYKVQASMSGYGGISDSPFSSIVNITNK